MDYNLTQNGYNYIPQQSEKRSFDLKGMLMTIVCLVLSIIVTISTFLPMISMGAGIYSESFNIIDTFDIIGESIDLLSGRIPDSAILGIILGTIIVLVPIAIMLYGIISAIVLTVKLITMKYVKSVSKFAWGIIILEMIFGTLELFYVVLMAELLNADIEYAVDIGLSVGWYLPVILSLGLLFAHIGVSIYDKVKTGCAGNIIVRAFGIASIALTSVMYLTFVGAYFDIVDRTGDFGITFAYIVSLMLNWDVNMILITIFLIAMGTLLFVCFLKNIKNTINGKYNGVLNLVVGALAIVFSITNYILFDIYIGDRYGRYTEMSMGMTSYIYIIFGSILLIMGIVYMCIRGYMGSRQNTVINQQYYTHNMPQSRDVAGQNVSYVNQAQIPATNYGVQQESISQNNWQNIQ